MNVDHDSEAEDVSNKRTPEGRTYCIYFQINRQEPFMVHCTEVSTYVKLKHSDEYAFNYINDLIESNIISNEDSEIEMIFRSIDEVDFTPIDVKYVKKKLALAPTTSETSVDFNADAPRDEKSSTAVAQMVCAEASAEAPKITKPMQKVGHCQIDTKSTQLVKESSFEVDNTSTPPSDSSKPQEIEPFKHALKLKSMVWKHFSKVDSYRARCIYCAKVIQHGGNTTNMKQHLNRLHLIQVKPSERNNPKETSTGDETANKKTGYSSCSDFSETDEPAVLIPNVGTKRKRQKVTPCFKDQQIDQVFQRTQSFRDGGTSAEKITNAILFMIAADNCPLSTVENEGFLSLMKAAAPLYHVPSRRTIVRLIDNKYEDLKCIFKREITRATSLTLTCDIWSDVTNHGYLGVTVHYLASNAVMKSGNLEVFVLEENHTANYIAQVMKTAIAGFEIDTSKITAVVSDSGSNIKKAMIEMFGPSRHIPCIAHLLSHVVPDTIKETPGVNEVIAKVKNIVTLTKRSVVASDELRRLQLRDGKNLTEILKFKQDVPTRWNSTLHMIERFLLLKEYVNPITLKCSTPLELLTRNELDLLNDLVLVLKPIENVISELSGDMYVTSSLVIPIIRCMSAALVKRKPSTEVGIMFLSKMILAVERRFDGLESIEPLAIATILDPRFKKTMFKKPLAAAAAIRKVNGLIKSNIKESTLNRANDENIPPNDKDCSVWSYHDEIAGSTNRLPNSESSDLCLELKQYLSQPVISRSENPIEYWKTLKHAYPSVHLYAIKYLSVVATSVPSERLFSKAGSIKAERRSRLTAERLDTLILLGSLSKNDWGII